MHITDIMPLDQWQALEQEVHERFGMNASVADEAGVRITTYANWANELCPRIKGDPKGLAAICAVAGQHFTSMFQAGRDVVVEECDAGLTKFAVAVRVGDEYLGNVGGCGLVAEDGEVESFFVAQSLQMDQGEAEALAAGVPVMTQERAGEITDWLTRRVDGIVKEYRA